ncbi:MAG: tetratricopeptide repeat protein [Planctomycetota bacterium]|jgi:predicted Zn-dependent protease
MPSSGTVQFLLARGYRRLGRNSLVHTHLQSALKLGYSPDSVRREEWLALAQTGQLALAEPHLGELLSTPQDDGQEVCEAFVNGYLRQYRFHDALRMLDAWQADFPDDALPLFTRGLIFEHLGRDRDAEEMYSKALAIQPDYPQAFLQRAQVRLAMKQPDTAAMDFKAAARSSSLKRDATIGLVNCLFLQAEFDAAARKLKGLRTLYPDDHDVLKLSARLAIDEGRLDDAIAFLNPVRTRAPNDLEACDLLSRALRSAGRTDEAVPLLEFISRATQAYTRITELKSLLHDEPTNNEYRYELGKLLIEYDSGSDGVVLLSSLLADDPEHSGVHETLAAYFERTNKPELAAKHRHALRSPGTSHGDR